MIAIIPVRVNIFFHKVDENDQLAIKLTALKGLWGYNMEIPQGQWFWDELLPYLYLKSKISSHSGKQLSEREVRVSWQPRLIISDLKKLFRIIKKIGKIKSIQRKLFKSTIIQDLKLHTEMGLKDAATTSVLYGIIWGAKYFIFASILQNSSAKFSCPNFMVTANYTKEIFRVEFNCIFTIRTGHIMLIGILTTWEILKALFERGDK
jgi:hypothetical protein